MPLSEFTRKLIETKLTEYCEHKIPMHARDKVKLIFSIRGNIVTLFETRPYFHNPSIWTEVPVAQFRYDNKSNKWTLYCADRNSKWHLYTEAKPSGKVDDLLKELDRDPTGIFWG
jgi:hypothetical protein